MPPNGCVKPEPTAPTCPRNPILRSFHLHEQIQELPQWPQAMPAEGFVWLALQRHELQDQLAQVQSQLLALAGGTLVDLHISDLLNPQLPSQYGYTSWYDLLVFRRLATHTGPEPTPEDTPPLATGAAGAHGGAPTLPGLDTRPVGFAVFDRVLLSVHPEDCPLPEHFAQRLAQLGPQGGTATEGRGAVNRLPPSPADLMVRMVNHLVDGYLDLRRVLSRQSDQLQRELLDRRQPFHHWQSLLRARNVLHQLENISEDQRSAMQEWIDALADWPLPEEAHALREREVLRVRSRDVLEHIERVLSHVRRIESVSEGAVQMHFSLQGNRTNDIMRTLTALTAVFLPLNLITGIFGMNFDTLPLIHLPLGFWITCGLMVAVVVVLLWVFRRRRYLDD